MLEVVQMFRLILIVEHKSILYHCWMRARETQFFFIRKKKIIHHHLLVLFYYKKMIKEQLF